MTAVVQRETQVGVVIYGSAIVLMTVAGWFDGGVEGAAICGVLSVVAFVVSQLFWNR